MRLWLREEPSEDGEAFTEQCARALVLEERTLKGLAGHTAAALGKALGGR